MSFRRHTGVAWAIACALAAPAFARAADLQPIDAVLGRIEPRSADTAAAAATPAATLARDIVAFRTRVEQMPAPQAASAWLALWDRAVALEPKQAANDYDAYDPATRSLVGPRSLLSALPAPEAWPAIRAQADARAAKNPDQLAVRALQFLADVLSRDADAARQTLAAVERLASSEGIGDRELRLYAIGETRSLLYKLYGTRAQIADAFRASVDGRTKQMFGRGVDVPDLVGLLGPVEAEALLADALKKPVTLQVPEGAATQALARRVALRDVATLRKPQWALIDGVGSAALYEAMSARFDPKVDGAPGTPGDEESGETDYQRVQADLAYFLDLVVAGRHADAERAMVRVSRRGEWLVVPKQAMAELARRGQSAAVHAYLADLLRRRPELPAWDLYLEQAGALGQSKEAIALLDAALKRPDLTPVQRARLTEKRLDALLGADQVDAAVAGFRVLLAAAPSRDDPKIDERTTAAIRLAGLGRVLNKPEWSRLGVDYATRAVALPVTESSYWRGKALSALLAELRREGRVDAAQTLALAELDRSSAASGFKGLAAIVANQEQRAALVELVGLYDAANRPADVRRMLDEVGVWGAQDLGELAANYDTLGRPIGLMAARALRAQGRVDAAKAAARAVIAQWPGHDPAYQLFVELAGDSAIAELDRLAERDPFEERPLIWKAVALNGAKQYAAAEETARRAIAIDPSDGEQGVNDRMRAYAVLADALEGRGDRQSALVYRRAVEAIRMSERADELQKLGLYQRASAGYQAALAQFADAYCIQSRLAVQLGRLGRQEEALKHYRRAFELMPDSFGRVESHCLGCESVFAGPSAQAIADEVFTKLIASGTTKPQAPYMLGYLRKEQGRYDDAVVLFRRAISTDALYLNAWKQLNDLGSKTYIEPAERDIAQLRLFELDPQQRHVRYRLDEVSDLPALWRAAVHRADAGGDAGAAVYPLAASVRARQQALASLPPEMRTQMERFVAVQATMVDEAAHRTPAGLQNHKLLLAAISLLSPATPGGYMTGE